MLLKTDTKYFMNGGVVIMRRKSKLRSAVFSLAICVGIFAAWCCVLLMAEEYYSARHKLDVCRQEVQTWEACRQTKPSYFKSNSEVVSSCLKNYNQARGNFWVSLPKEQLIGLFVLVAVGSATAGYLATWVVLRFVCLSVNRFVRLLAFCLWRKQTRQVNSCNT